MLNNIAAIEAHAPDPALIQRAVRLLAGGGMVVLPTRHLYGLGVDALNADAVARVFAAKQRSPRQPLLILAASREAVSRYVQSIDDRAAALMRAFWPGRLTIVLDARPVLPAGLTGGTGRIGVRVPEHPVSLALVRALGRPITATSANLSGQPGCHRITDLDPEVAAAADLLLDAGPLRPGIGSTVVDIRPTEVRLLREGAVSSKALRNVIGKLVVPPGRPKSTP